MPRRREVPTRAIIPDPKYNNKLVSRFITCIMRAGKKSYPVLTGRVRVIAHGGTLPVRPARDERRQAREWLGVAGDGPVLLFFGMIRSYKGLEHLIAALPGVLAVRPETRLVIAGEPLMPLASIERAITRLGVGSAIIRRYGFVPSADVPRYFAAADLLVAPHVGQVGVSGVVVLALAYRLAVVATNVGGASIRCSG